MLAKNTVHFYQSGATLFLEGACDFHTSKKSVHALEKALLVKNGVRYIDLGKVSNIDFTFIMFCLTLAPDVDFIASDAQALEVISIAKECARNARGVIIPKEHKDGMLEALGRSITTGYYVFSSFCNFLGVLLLHIALAFMHPSRLRINSLLYHINTSVFEALPIGLLTSFIVAAAITLQGAIQLNALGAPLMSIDTTAKLALREMGPFILAIVIAGRSASSFTAQIGAMRLTEEINAMKTMGFDIYDFLVIPRLLALVLAMPLLVFLADAISLLAGMMVIKFQLGISYEGYIEHFYETVSLTHFFIGLSKAPFFGAAIALVGCFRGLEARGDTESIGRYTTISVVNALFWCIAINALFSFITAVWDI